MNYYTIAPSPALSPYVRFFWVLESDEPYCHRSMADGCVEIIFHYKGSFDEITMPGKVEKSFTAGLHGPSQNYRRFTINESFGIFGAYLYPFAIPHLFSIPTSELSDQMPDLASLFSADGKELEEKIMLAASNRQSRPPAQAGHRSAKASLQRPLVKTPFHRWLEQGVGRSAAPALAIQRQTKSRQRHLRQFPV